MPPLDTSPEAQAAQLDAYRRMGGPARTQLAAQMSSEARQITRDGIRSRRPLYSSAEDTVVSKLEWATIGASERQIRDVQGVVAVQGERLDVAHIERWVDVLGLQEQCRTALKRA
jgi:hypothetical protein